MGEAPGLAVLVGAAIVMPVVAILGSGRLQAASTRLGYDKRQSRYAQTDRKTRTYLYSRQPN
jgi:hypothetical protein